MIGFTTPEVWHHTKAQTDWLYTSMREFGARIVRVGIPWGLHNHAAADRVINGAIAAGLDPLVCIVWPRKQVWFREGTAAEFAQFCGMLAKRYPTVDFELWNEPNLGRFWHLRPSAAAYAQFLTGGTRAIRAAGNGQTVVAAGLAACVTWPKFGWRVNVDPVDFLNGMRAAGAEYDVAAYHPYALTPDFKQLQNVLGHPMVRKADEFTGRVWWTEAGSSTTVRSFAQQDDDLENIIALFRASTAERLYLHTYRDYGTSSSIEHGYGIVDYIGQHKLAYERVKSLISQG